MFRKIAYEEYSPNQKMIADFVNQLSKKYTREYWMNKAEKKEFPTEMWNEIAENGYLGIIIPEVYGGADFSFSDLKVFLEELATKGLMTLHFVSFFMDIIILLLHGSEELKKEYLPQMAKGTYFSFALSEPDAGTNSLKITTKAEKKGSYYYVKGTKVFITGADESKYMVVAARTQDYNEKDKKKGLSLFVIDSHTDGITMMPQDVEIMSPDSQYTVYFDNVKVHEKNLIGKEGEGFSYLLSGLNLERIIISCFCLGMGKYVLKKAVEYAKVRNIFGDPIGKYQAVQHPLSRAFMNIQLASIATREAAKALDSKANSKLVGMYANIAKLSASEAAFNACDAAIQTLGGYGLTKEHDIINFFIPIRTLRIAPINNEMILNYLGEKFLGLPRSY